MAIPTAQELIVPTQIALQALGGSGTNGEIQDQVIRQLMITEEEQAISQGGKNPNISKLEYRLRWARTMLKNIDAITRSGSGLWTLLPLGYSASPEELLKKYQQWQRSAREPVGQGEGQAPSPVTVEAPETVEAASDGYEDEDSDEWVSAVVTAIQAMDPANVERLFLRVLREEGFSQLEHVGKPGDGGIDGTGVYRVSLLAFKIYFQCKRYKGSIGAKDMRDFRGAMEGRGERGLFVTTSWFTSGAKDEATKPGARHIDLIEGAAFARLLAKNGLGVLTGTRKTYEIHPGFFQDFS